LESARTIKDLDAVIGAVGYNNPVLLVRCNALGQIELPGPIALRPEAQHMRPRSIEYLNPIIQAIRDDDAVRAIDGNASRTIEFPSAEPLPPNIKANAPEGAKT
jgi:hypothetical protein